MTSKVKKTEHTLIKGVTAMSKTQAEPEELIHILWILLLVLIFWPIAVLCMLINVGRKNRNFAREMGASINQSKD